MDGGLELERGIEGGQERGSRLGGELGGIASDSPNTDGASGARGSPFNPSLLDPPRPPTRTDSAPQPPSSHPLPLPPPPPSLCAELLELGDSLMKLGNITTPYDLDTNTFTTHTQDQPYSHHAYDHSTIMAPYALEHSYSDCSHSQDPNALTGPYSLDHITITRSSDHSYSSQDQSHCHSSVYMAESEYTGTYTLERPSNPAHNGSYNPEHRASYERIPKPESSYTSHPERPNSYTPEHTDPHTHERTANLAPQPPAPSPDPEPELLLSPVVPPGGPFTPNDPESLEPLDPAASAQLLDNIMAWFSHNINPQNSPQSLALIPSPPTTETDSSPDAVLETGSERQSSREVPPALIRLPPEGEPEVGSGAVTVPCPGAGGAEGVEVVRPSTLELESREAVEECEDTRGVSDLPLDVADTHRRLHTHCGDCPAHTAHTVETDLDHALQLEEDQSPEEWVEQVHLV